MKETIEVEHVSKKFCRRLRHTMLYGCYDILRSTLGLSPSSGRLRPGEFWALNDISFEVNQGGILGIIGPNGAGKTTILKLLNGIFMPDKGQIRIKGRVGSLIEIGAGFHPMLTGRENIYINGAILGMNKREIDKKFDSIVDFADIGDFIDSPVKHYSSGMYVRLGFSIAAHAEPDILLIDEVLAVGDFSFQLKCHDKIREFKNQAKTIIFVSHNLGGIKSLCDKVIYLNEGEIINQGYPAEVIDSYLIETIVQKKEPSLKKKYQNLREESMKRWGSREIEIIEVKFFNAENKENYVFKSGDKFVIRLKFRAHKKIKRPVFGIAIYNSDGFYCMGANTKSSNQVLEEIEGSGVVNYIIESLPLLRGRYLVTVAVHNDLDTVPYDHHDQRYEFKVVSGETEPLGIFRLLGQWKIEHW